MNLYKLIYIIIMLLVISCSKKPATSTGNSSSILQKEFVESEDVSETSHSIPVSVKLVSSDFCVSKETDSVITIEPCTPYYKKWMSANRMELDVLSDLGYCDDLDYPVLDFYIVNNSDKAIDITSLDFIVNQSTIDQLPYIYICHNGYYRNMDPDNDDKQVAYYNRLIMRNESWSNWGKMNLDYKILKRGESFDGKYNRRKVIPYFEDEYLVDFTSDFVEMGLDMKYLFEHQYDQEYDGMDAFWLREHSLQEIVKIFYPFEVEERDEMACGFARIYGKISFTKSNFTKQFNGVIYITPPGGGAADGYDDIFDVELKYEGCNYKYSYPYTTVLYPGDHERVKLKIKCPRSSNHRFFISINNDNGLMMRTKDIQMHYLNGRHSTMQPMFTRLGSYKD